MPLTFLSSMNEYPENAGLFLYQFVWAAWFFITFLRTAHLGVYFLIVISTLWQWSLILLHQKPVWCSRANIMSGRPTTRMRFRRSPGSWCHFWPSSYVTLSNNLYLSVMIPSGKRHCFSRRDRTHYASPMISIRAITMNLMLSYNKISSGVLQNTWLKSGLPKVIRSPPNSSSQELASFTLTSV